MKLTERRDGTIRIEAIGTREPWGDEEPDSIQICDHESGEGREIQVGDEGCFVTTEPETDTSTILSACLWDDPYGYPGNTNHNIYRLHGWRGTTGGEYCEAHGWRRVKSIEPRKRGVGYVVILSADMKPDKA